VGAAAVARQLPEDRGRNTKRSFYLPRHKNTHPSENLSPEGGYDRLAALAGDWRGTCETLI